MDCDLGNTGVVELDVGLECWWHGLLERWVEERSFGKCSLRGQMLV